MRTDQMPESMRFTKQEQKDLHTMCIKINKLLMSADQMPIRESELAHLILEKALSRLVVTKSGDVDIE